MTPAKSSAGAVISFEFTLPDQPGKWAADLETLMNCLLTAHQDALTLWNVKVHGELLDAHERPLPATDMLMTCYFNIGIDAEIGASKLTTAYNIMRL